MFLREQIVRSDGHDYKYLKVVENVWENGRTKQVTLINLGNVSRWPDGKLREAVEILGRFLSIDMADLASVDIANCRSLGPYLLLNHVWDELGLDQIITQAISVRAVSQLGMSAPAQMQAKGRSLQLPVAQYVRAMVFNRLVAPSSKKAVWEWLPRDVFVPGLVPDELPWHGYYRALEYLNEAKAPIEQALHARIANLFNRDLSLVFYDLTSTYFEGSHCGRSKYGYSRDHRPDCLQIEIGLLVDADGLTIGHEVFDGNVPDVKTVLGTLDRLKEDFGVRRCVFVSDDGMTSQENILAIEARGYEYITSLSLGKSVIGTALVRTCPPKKDFTRLADNLLIYPLKADAVEHAGGISCPAEESSTDYNLQDWEGCLQPDNLQDGNVRYIAAYNPVRAAATRRHRKERLRACLDYLQQRRAPRKSGPEAPFLGATKRKPSAASLRATEKQATQLIAKKRVQELIRIEQDPQGNWVGILNKEAIRQARKQDGLVILQTNSKTLTDSEIALGYRTLWKVENAFRHIKNLIRLRPIRHWSDPRVLGHVNICVLAYTLECLLERKLQQAKVPMTAYAALEEMRSLMVATLSTEQQQVTKRSKITQAQQIILNAVGVPPVPELWETANTTIKG